MCPEELERESLPRQQANHAPAKRRRRWHWRVAVFLLGLLLTGAPYFSYYWPRLSFMSSNSHIRLWPPWPKRTPRMAVEPRPQPAQSGVAPSQRTVGSTGDPQDWSDPAAAPSTDKTVPNLETPTDPNGHPDEQPGG